MMWLNLAERVILIKALLAALPIYQYEIIMAPSSAHKQMELILRSFLWQGGKQENKKFSLVRWEQLVLPYEQEDLSIRIPGLMNIALGMKIVWGMITGKGSSWKKLSSQNTWMVQGKDCSMEISQQDNVLKLGS